MPDRLKVSVSPASVADWIMKSVSFLFRSRISFWIEAAGILSETQSLQGLAH